MALTQQEELEFQGLQAEFEPIAVSGGLTEQEELEFQELQGQFEPQITEQPEQQSGFLESIIGSAIEAAPEFAGRLASGGVPFQKESRAILGGLADLPIGLAQSIVEELPQKANIPFSGFSVEDLRKSLVNVTKETEKAAEEATFGELLRFVPQLGQLAGVGTGKLLIGKAGIEATGAFKAANVAARAGETAIRGAAVGSAATAAQPISEPDLQKAKAQRSKMFQTGAALGAAVPLGLTAALGGGIAIKNLGKQAVSPIVENLRKGFVTETRKSGQRLQKIIGETFTAAQLTENRFLRSIESSLRRSASTADSFFDKTQAQLGASLKFLNKSLDKITPQTAGSQAIGIRLKDSFNKAINTTILNRSKQAKLDFAFLDGVAGKRAVITIRPYVDELKKIIQEGTSTNATQTEKIFANNAKELLNTVNTNVRSREGVPFITGKIFQRDFLEKFGKASTGKVRFATDLDKGENIRFASRLFGSLKRSLDESIDSGSPAVLKRGDPTAKALSEVRDRFRINSEGIETLNQTRLGSLIQSKTAAFGEERISDTFKRFTPSELKESMQILQQHSPEAVPDIQRSFIQDAIDAASQAGREDILKFAPELIGEDVIEFSAKKFLSKLPTSEKLNALFGDKGDVVKKELAEVVGFLKRIALDTGLEGSPTFALQEGGRVARALTSITGSLVLSGRFIAQGKLAELLQDPIKRKAIIQLRNLTRTQPLPTLQTRDALSAITGVTFEEMFR